MTNGRKGTLFECDDNVVHGVTGPQEMVCEAEGKRTRDGEIELESLCIFLFTLHNLLAKKPLSPHSYPLSHLLVVASCRCSPCCLFSVPRYALFLGSLGICNRLNPLQSGHQKNENHTVAVHQDVIASVFKSRVLRYKCVGS